MPIKPKNIPKGGRGSGSSNPPWTSQTEPIRKAPRPQGDWQRRGGQGVDPYRAQQRGYLQSYWRNNPPPNRRWAPGAMTFESRWVKQGPPRETPFITTDEMISDLPNADLLTPTERTLYHTLPRIMNTQVFGKTIGDRLEGFNEGWMGKALNMLDFAAEGLERSYGFLSQWSDAYVGGTEQDREDFNNNLTEAWYAGSLWADMTNLPGFTRDENDKITGMTIPGHLPGRSGIVNARNRIAELTAQGMDYTEALTQVRNEYYNDLGALSIRAQMQDTYQHILLDPLNIVAGFIKPVELVKAKSVMALTGKIDNLDDLARVATELTEHADELAKLGKVEEAARAAEDAAKVTARIEALSDVPRLTHADKFAVWLTGGNPLEEPTTALGKLGRSRFNPFALSPESRGYEMLTVVSDNLDAYVLSKYDNAEDIMDALYRAETGALGPEFGHAFLTREGRVAQSAITAARSEADDLYSAFAATARERALLEDIVTATGDDIATVVKAFEDGNAAQYVQRLTDMGEDGARIAQDITDDAVDMISTFRKSEVPFTTDMFKMQLSDAVRESTAKLAIARFGIKERGVIMKASQAMKSAETLAFLRLNPTFVAKNFFNNEMTMLARGLGGPVLGSTLDDFVKTIGFTPHRFGQAFTIAGEEFGVTLGKGERVISDVLRGEAGFLQKLDTAIQGAGDKLPQALDMGTWASKMEASASKRAFMHGYTQGWNRYFWKPGNGFKTMAQSVPSEIFDELPRGFARALERRIAGVMNETDLRNIGNLESLNHTAAGIADDIVKEFGYHLDERMGADYVQQLTTRLDEAIPRGKNAVSNVIENARQEVATHLDEVAEAAFQQRVDEIAAAVEMAGPNGLVTIWGDGIDELRGAELAYDMRMSRLDPSGLTGEAADVFWKRTKADTDAFWTRQWKRYEAMLEGMKKGAKNLKDTNGKVFKIPNEVTDGYAMLRKEWSGFISNRNKLHEEFFNAILEGKEPPRRWADIQIELNAEYAKRMQIEYDLSASIDDSITNMVRRTNPDAADAYAAWRQRARDLRMNDRQTLADFRTSLEGLSPKAKNDAWREFWKERWQRHVDMWNNERAGVAVLQDDPRAIGAYETLVPSAGHERELREIANRYKIPLASDKGIPLNNRIKDTVNVYLRGGYEPEINVFDELIDARGLANKDDLVEVLATDNDLRNELVSLVRQYGDDTQIGEIDKILSSRWTADDLEEYVLRERMADILEDIQRQADPRFTRLDGTTPQIESLDEVTPNLANDAFEARRVYYGDPEVELPEITEPQEFSTFVDTKLIDETKQMNPPLDIGEDQGWMMHGYTGLDDMERQVFNRMDEPSVNFANLTDEQNEAVARYLREVEGQMGDAKLAATKYGEFRRDSALLNYNRRYNYNNWLSTIFPFEFWTTQSLAKWALHSIDRPAMLTTYLRMRKFIETAGLQQNGFPSRLKGSLKINLPFLPDWMGNEFFVDPLRVLLPFDNWGTAADRYRQDMGSIDGRTERLIQDMVTQGQISQDQANEALTNRSGSVWDNAYAQAKLNDGEGMNDSWDYATMLLSPHAPLVWAKEALIDGTPENIGPFLPISRTMKQAFGVLGVDTSQAKWNVGGNIRHSLGLPAFDQWDDYRVDRELSNMAAEGYNLTDIKLAMISREGPLWEEASSRAARNFAGGGALPFLLKTLGIPTQAYPEGEQHQRALQDDFSRAYEAYDNGNVDALTRFLDTYPEYETRLALWKEPEERLQSFLVDNMWDQYNSMPSMNKWQLRDALGPEFQQYFLDRDTRNYDAISNETLQMWLKLMNGEPAGSLNSATQPIEFADSDQAWRVEQFYGLRRDLYPHYQELQDIYFKIDEENKAERRKFRDENPELIDYWNWRRDFFHRNPDVVPYLDDDFEFQYETAQEAQAAMTGMPTYTFQEWSYVVGSQSVANILARGDIPPSAEGYLEDLAGQLGLTLEQMVSLVGQSAR